MHGDSTGPTFHLLRFYASQPVIGHIEKSILMDDVKRRERESKERAVEAQMLDSLYQVSRTPCSHAS
jgi:hypothetical protein